MDRLRRLRLSVATLGGAMLLGGMLAGSAGPAAAHGEATSHPAHIHSGNCTAIGDVLFPLSDVGATTRDATPMAGGSLDQASAIPVDASVTTIEVALADVLAGDHTIVVHESADEIQNYVACGDIGGTMLGESDLPIGLGELNDSGISGIAWLHDNGDGTTDVTLLLTKTVVQPADGGMAVSEVPVTIEDFAYSAPVLEIAAGTTVTWTNLDGSAHTVSQVGGGVESGKIDPGATFSFTFDTAGAYEYFCQYHPNMKATINVS